MLTRLHRSTSRLLRRTLQPGQLLVAMGRLEEAAAHYAEVLRLAPNYTQAHNNLEQLFDAGQNRRGDRALRTRRSLAARSRRCSRQLGQRIRERSQVAAAVDAYQRALQIQPPNGIQNQKRWHITIWVRHTSARRPDAGKLHFREASSQRSGVRSATAAPEPNGFYSSAEPSIEQLETRLADPRLPPEPASQLHFVLGYLLLEREGDTDQAFDHFSRGNELRRLCFRRRAPHTTLRPTHSTLIG